MNAELLDDIYCKLSYKGPLSNKRPEPNFMINEPYLIYTPYENGTKHPNMAIYSERALG